MQYGICSLTLVPMRAEPSHKSEMVNQMLLGEVFNVIESYNGWFKITLEHDNYTGWISANAYTPITAADYKILLKNKKFICGSPVVNIKDIKTKLPLLMPAGSYLQMFDKKSFYAGDKRYSIDSENKPLLISGKKDFLKLSDAAKLFLGSPYLWGGRSILGIDCSGLVQIAARLAGISLPRNASQQIAYGETVDFISEARAGDIAFFEDNEGNIIHTGIINEDADIIHAHAYVRIDGIDHNGIYNKITCTYSHKLRLIKRISA